METAEAVLLFAYCWILRAGPYVAPVVAVAVASSTFAFVSGSWASVSAATHNAVSLAPVCCIDDDASRAIRAASVFTSASTASLDRPSLVASGISWPFDIGVFHTGITLSPTVGTRVTVPTFATSSGIRAE